MAHVLDGKKLAEKTRADLSIRIDRLKKQTEGKNPVLATILVGNDPSSATYVKMKGAACGQIGMQSRKVLLPESTTTAGLLNQIDALNADPDVQGILLQHPVPVHIDEQLCFDRISLAKDVDGVSAHSFGRVVMGNPCHCAATPMGIMHLLTHYNIDLRGKEAVVVGRSPILGKPMAMMLLNADATVTICHSRTTDLPKVVGRADIVVGACGQPELIKGSWIKEGTVIIDAGYHSPHIGDIELAAAIPKASAYTPMPGGVGPMTITTLLSQTVDAAEAALL